ncbi:MAG: ABC transporter ATP-binding protein [Clostridia bacterium]|nr:ABC transporter ATP-binding protein [Clostridia bacterium]
MLRVDKLTVKYGDLTVVDEVSFAVEPGMWLMLVGPNGAGKSTIVTAISQGVDYGGVVELRGEDIKQRKPRELARELGVLAQSHNVNYAFTVWELVRLGRYVYGGKLFGTHPDDDAHIRDALKKTGMEALGRQSVLTLSGGELQRAFLAQVFAQDPSLLLLDEPTNHLDLIYQKQVFELIREWLHEGDRAVVSVVHDLSLAKAYGTHALLLDRGRALAYGGIKDALSDENLARAYDMDVTQWMKEMLEQWN